MAISLPKSSICLRRRRRRLARSSSRAASEFPSRSVWQASHPVWVTPLSPAARLWGFSPLCLKPHSSQLCLHPDTLRISTFLLRLRHFLPIPPHPLCSPSQSPHPAAPSFPPRFFFCFFSGLSRSRGFYFSSLSLFKCVTFHLREAERKHPSSTFTCTSAVTRSCAAPVGCDHYGPHLVAV